jgi:prephenate dehydrogenase
MRAVGVVGIGHIGGAVAKAWLGGCAVLVMDTDDEALASAARDGCVVVESFQDLRDCEVIVAAVPPRAVGDVVVKALAAAPGAVVTDTCGVRSVCAAIHDPRFVGGHPMAGLEGQGYASSDPNIFKSARWIITPHTQCSPMALAKICDFVSAMGADVLLMSETDHDRAVAHISHMPHIIANALRHGLGSSTRESELAAGSFRSATRVAGSNPELWAELWTANREHVLQRLADHLAEIKRFRAMLEDDSREALADWVRRAKEQT